MSKRNLFFRMSTHCFVSAFHGNQNKTSATYHSNKHTPAINGTGMYTLIPFSTVRFRRLLPHHLIKKLPVLFENKRFNSRVHKGPQPNPTLTIRIQYTLSHLIPLRPILILSSG